jgi:hypothetical protein
MVAVRPTLISYRLKCFPFPVGNDVQFRVRKPLDVVRARQTRNFGTRARSQRLITRPCSPAAADFSIAEFRFWSSDAQVSASPTLLGFALHRWRFRVLNPRPLGCLRLNRGRKDVSPHPTPRCRRRHHRWHPLCALRSRAASACAFALCSAFFDRAGRGLMMKLRAYGLVSTRRSCVTWRRGCC